MNNLSLPTSLTDLVGEATPAKDEFGNTLFANWSLHLPKVQAFNISLLQSSAPAHLVNFNYASSMQWPTLHNFIELMVDNSFPDRLTNYTELTTNILEKQWDEFKILNYLLFDVHADITTVVIIGLILSFIGVPIVAIVIALAYRASRSQFRYNPYSSDSLATYKGGTRSQIFRRPAALSIRLVVMLICAALCGFCSVVSIMGSIHYNEELSNSLLRSEEVIVDNVVKKTINFAESNIQIMSNNFDKIYQGIQDSIEKKAEFITNSMLPSFEQFQDPSKSLDLLQKSQALLLLMVVLSWERATIDPLIESLENTQTTTVRLSELQLQIMKLSVNSTEIRNKFCQDYQPTTCNDYLTTTNINVCYGCLMPNFQSTIDPFRLQSNNQTAVQVVRQLLNTTRQMKATKMSKLIIQKEDIMKKFGKEGLAEAVQHLISHYTVWYERYIVPIVTGQPCDTGKVISPNGTTGVTNATTITTVTPPTTTNELTINTTVTAVPNNTSPPLFTPTPPPSMFHNTFDFFKDFIYRRQYGVLTLLIFAVIQLALLIVGCFLLLALSCGCSESRPRKTTTIEKTGRGFVLAGAVIYISIVGPLLCIVAGTHFLIGTIVTNEICPLLHSEDYTFSMLDDQLNGLTEDGNFVRSQMPPCIVAAIDSIDLDLLDNRLSFGKLLNASKHKQTATELLRPYDTTFVKELVTLEHLKPPTRFGVFNSTVTEYLETLNAAAQRKDYFASLVKSLSLSDAANLKNTLEKCTTCVVGTLSQNTSTGGLDEAEEYKTRLTRYIGEARDAVFNWNNTVEFLEIASQQGAMLKDTLYGVDRYFTAIRSLILDKFVVILKSVIEMLVDIVQVEVIPLDPFYEMYTGVRGYLCTEITGNLNAFWFFTGAYLVFTTISSLLSIAVFSSLKNLRRGEELRSSTTGTTLVNNNFSSASLNPVSSSSKLKPLGGYPNKGYVDDNGNSASATDMAKRKDSFILVSVSNSESQSSPVSHSSSSRQSDASVHLVAGDDSISAESSH